MRTFPDLKDDEWVVLIVKHLEKAVRHNPEDRNQIISLLNVLENFEPPGNGDGFYNDCQVRIAEDFSNNFTFSVMSDLESVRDLFCSWKETLPAFGVTHRAPVMQAVFGTGIIVSGEKPNCEKRLAFFEKASVITRLCDSCYKVQILAADILTLIRLTGVLRNLELPRDNSRKGMVEVRPDVRFPYKGYIYCQSEEEAIQSRNLFLEAAAAAGLTRFRAAISHGCSEFGLKYPEWKYSADGTHRHFTWPDGWLEQEQAQDFTSEETKFSLNSFNRKGITLKDVFALDTWLDYAEIIGDESGRFLRPEPANEMPPLFRKIVTGQAETRKKDQEELLAEL